jgi:hypothetical protein
MAVGINAPGHNIAVDSSDNRLVAVAEPPLGSGLQLDLCAGCLADSLLEVCTGAERPISGAGHDKNPGIRVGLKLLVYLLHPQKILGGQGVPLLRIINRMMRMWPFFS